MVTTTTPNFDTLQERLRERVQEADDDYDGGHCSACDVQLTATDRENEACTNCSVSLVDDESVDEDLLEVELGDYGWDGYDHGD